MCVPDRSNCHKLGLVPGLLWRGQLGMGPWAAVWGRWRGQRSGALPLKLVPYRYEDTCAEESFDLCVAREVCGERRSCATCYPRECEESEGDESEGEGIHGAMGGTVIQP